MYQNGISVIICCHNSAIRLPETITCLAQQKVPVELQWEIILINNASTDNTITVARSEWAKHSLLSPIFKVVNEPKPGLSNARETGIQTANYNCIIFCDDDNWLDKNYLKTAYQIITENPQIAALGGQSTAASSIELPDWFEASKNNYAVGKQADQSGDVTYRKHLWGSGIVIRKDVYLKAFKSFPSLLSGRKENILSSGEDSEICMRFILMGYKLYYSEKLKFTHYIPQERLTKAYNKRLVEGFIGAHTLLKIYSTLIDLRTLSFRNKYVPLIKSGARILLAWVLHTNRWNIALEKQNVYLTTGFRFKSIPEDVVMIKKFSRRALWL